MISDFAHDLCCKIQVGPCPQVFWWWAVVLTGRKAWRWRWLLTPRTLMPWRSHPGTLKRGLELLQLSASLGTAGGASHHFHPYQKPANRLLFLLWMHITFAFTGNDLIHYIIWQLIQQDNQKRPTEVILMSTTPGRQSLELYQLFPQQMELVLLIQTRVSSPTISSKLW